MADKSVIDTIIAEAGGDGLRGMQAVAWAIANRAAKTGKTPEQVVKEPHQFEGYSNPGSASRRAQRNPELRAKVESILSQIDAGTLPDPLKGGTMFHASNINPYWASSENQHGTVKIGGQTYYLGGSALPPANIPNVASLTDTVAPRSAPIPAIPSIDTALMRNPINSVEAQRAQVTPSIPSFGPMGTPDVASLYAGIAQPQSGPVEATKTNRVRPDIVGNSFASLPANDTALAAALNRPVPAIPSLPLASTRSANSTFDAGLQAALQRPRPATPSLPLAEARAAQTAVDPGLQAALAQRQSPIGQPPATRTVASVPVPALPRPMSYAGQDAGAPYTVPADRPNVPQSYAGQDTGPTRVPDRLTASYGLPELYGAGIAPQQVASIGTPLSNEVNAAGRRVTVPPTLPGVPQVQTAQAMPATPAVAAIQAASQPTSAAPSAMAYANPVSNPVAPVPMPRINRVAKIGNWQVPGIAGGIMTAMNNASGPYNNGADNLLYNIFRGGDFNTPGAATATSGGYLFAPREGGGYINVGRDPKTYAQTRSNTPSAWTTGDSWWDHVTGRES